MTAPIALLALALVLVAVPSAHAGEVAEFRAFLDPPTAFTDVDSTVSVEFLVDSTAMHFNAYEITIQFDPHVLEFVAVARGSAMSDACGFNLDFSNTTDSTVTYSHTLMCANTFVDGPGQLSVFTFRGVGEGVSPLSITSNPNCAFFDAGICVSPAHPTFPRQVVLSDGVVFVGDDPTASPEPLDQERTSLSFLPNPTRAGGVFRAARPSWSERRVAIVDVSGRRVYETTWPGGAPALAWSGFDRSGARLAPGVYFAHVLGERSRDVRRIVVVR